jgi:hypothetical protein
VLCLRKAGHGPCWRTGFFLSDYSLILNENQVHLVRMGKYIFVSNKFKFIYIRIYIILSNKISYLSTTLYKSSVVITLVFLNFLCNSFSFLLFSLCHESYWYICTLHTFLSTYNYV